MVCHVFAMAGRPDSARHLSVTGPDSLSHLLFLHALVLWCTHSPRFHSQQSEARNSAVSENEASVLRLTPKFAVFDNVDVRDAECQIEKGLCKLRWNRMNNESPEEDTQACNVSSGSSISSSISTRTRPTSNGPQDPHNHSSGPHLSLSNDMHGASTGHSTLPSTNPINNPTPCPNPTPTPSQTAANDPGPAAIPIVMTSGSRHWPYDPETCEIDMRHLRSTDLPFNQ